MTDSNDGRVKKKNWFSRHKVLSVILGILAVIVLASAMGGDSKNNTSNGSKSNSSQKASAKTYRFADRSDRQSKDIEVLPNETATVDGVKMTVTSVEYKTSMSEFETADAGKTYIVADVNLENTSNRTQPYNQMDFRIQTAGGQVLDSTFATTQSPLNSGDLVAGGKVRGQVVFQVPVEDGHQYVIWKPGFASDRAIVQVK